MTYAGEAQDVPGILAAILERLRALEARFLIKGPAGTQGPTGPSGMASVSVPMVLVDTDGSALSGTPFDTLNVISYGQPSGDNPGILLRGARGTQSSPAETQDGDVLGEIDFAGTLPTNLPAFTQAVITATQRGAAGAHGAELDISATKLVLSSELGLTVIDSVSVSGHGCQIAINANDAGDVIFVQNPASTHSLGFFNATTSSGPRAAQQTVTGARGGNPALASLLSALAAYGLVVDDSTADEIPVAESIQTGSTYTFVLADAGTVVEGNSASAQTFTVPPNSSVAFPTGAIIEVFQLGAGQITIAPGSGVTLRSDGSKTKTAAQYATIGLRKRATDEWVLTGDLA